MLKTTRKLSLKKETLRQLSTVDSRDLAAVGGGAASGRYCGSGGSAGQGDGTFTLDCGYVDGMVLIAK